MIFWSFVFPVILLCCSIGMMVWHHRSWQQAKANESDEKEFDFRRRQYRRRMQTSAMLGIVSIGIFVGQFLKQMPTAAVCVWGGVLILLAWVGLLAIADVVSTRHHFGRLRDDYLIEGAKLEAEMRRLKSAQSKGGNGHVGNGRAKKNKPPQID